jgi:hypothetical protein
MFLFLRGKMLPLYQPGIKPKPPVHNLQRRTVHPVAVVSETPLLMMAQPPPPPLSPRVRGKRSIGTWIGGAVLVFWAVLITLFFISHLITSPSRHLPPAAAAIHYQNTSFTMLPTQGRFLNVSIGYLGGGDGSWYRTCCWLPKEESLHCDGNGMFSTHVQRSLLVVRVIQTDIIGARCVFHAWNHRH